MPRYVLTPDVALHLAREQVSISSEHQLLAPTLFRSQLLSELYRSRGAGEVTWKEADRVLGYLRGLKIRFLGDRVLQEVAWKAAAQLGWPDTLDAEYVALTQLQADALITLDPELVRAVEGIVATATVEDLK